MHWQATLLWLCGCCCLVAASTPSPNTFLQGHYYDFTAAFNASSVLQSRASNPSESPVKRAGSDKTFPITIYTGAGGFHAFNLLSNAIVDMWLLCEVALGSIGCTGQESSSFLSYFSANDRETVVAVYKTILSGFRQQDQAIQNPEFKNSFAIYYNNGETPQPGSVAASDEDDGNHLHCGTAPVVLGAGPSPVQAHSSEFLGPIASDLNDLRFETVICEVALETKSFLAKLDCGSVGAEAGYRVSSGVEVLGAVLLHELTHWCRVIGLQASGYSDCHDRTASGEHVGIIDWNSQVKDPGIDPLNGYGPYNAMQINRLHGMGAINADNYVWFAMEALLSSQCADELVVADFNDPLP